MDEQNSLDQSILPALVLLGSVALALLLVFAAQAPNPQGATAATTPTAMVMVVTASPEPTAETAPTQAHIAEHAVADDPVILGEQIFQRVCTACHGFDAKGITGLGKSLINSEFVNGMTDEELTTFILQGRDVTDPLNTTGVAMPARGGNPSLTDEDIAHIVAYIRSLNTLQTVAAPTMEAPQVAVVAEPFVPADINALDAALVPPSSGANGILNLSLNDGQSIYLWACTECHGAAGQGVAGFGSAINESTLDKAQLTQLLTQIAANAGDFAHPYQGGYPELSEPQISSLVEYLNTLQ